MATDCNLPTGPARGSLGVAHWRPGIPTDDRFRRPATHPQPPSPTLSDNKYTRFVDRMTGGLGRFISWMALLMVLIGAYNAVARYLGRFIGVNLSSNLYLELQWYLFSLIFLLGAGFALKDDAHVRVDVVYGRLRARTRAMINVIGAALMLLPFTVFVLWVSWPSIRNSWAVLESSPDPGGLPRYPLKAVIIVAFVLLLAQGVSEFCKDWAVLRRGDGGSGDGAESETGEAPVGGIGL